jgi:thioredoxin 1
VLRRHPDVQAVRIDVDSDLPAPSRFDVLSIPTLLLFHGGTEIGRLDGLIRESDIDQALTAAKAGLHRVGDQSADAHDRE